jgi:hypothetical protein
LYSLVIEPGPHLCHRSDEVNATAPNLDNVHRATSAKCFLLRRYIARGPTVAMSVFAAIALRVL